MGGIINWFVERGAHPKGDEDEMDAFIAAFRNVGVDFNQTLLDGLAHSNSTTLIADYNELVNKAFAHLFLNIFDVCMADLCCQRADSFIGIEL